MYIIDVTLFYLFNCNFYMVIYCKHTGFFRNREKEQNVLKALEKRKKIYRKPVNEVSSFLGSHYEVKN